MLSPSARAWLNTLLLKSIFSWVNLQEKFLNNFLDIYQCLAS